MAGVALLISVHSGSASAAPCLRLDPTPQNETEDGVDVIVRARAEIDQVTGIAPALVTTGGYGDIDQWLGDGHTERDIVRSAYVLDDVGATNYFEFGWYRVKGQTDVTVFKAAALYGDYSRQDLSTRPFGQHRIGIAPSIPDLYIPPFVRDWHGYFDEQEMGAYGHVFEDGWFETAVERFNTCDDGHGRWWNLHYRAGRLDYRSWPEMMIIARSDPNYDCKKNDQLADTVWFSEVLAEPAPFCAPDVDPDQT